MTCAGGQPGKQIEDCTAPGSMLTDFNIWDRSLSDTDLLSWTTCRYADNKMRLSFIVSHTNCFRILTKGNFINWDESAWYLDEEMEWINKGKDEVCLLPQPRNILFPEYRTNSDMHMICNKLKGHLSVSDSQEMQDALIHEFKTQMPHEMSGYQTCKLYQLFILFLVP